MQAIILAAGYATRLYPDTQNFPKALLSVGGRPMLDHLTDGILSVPEVSRVIVISNDRFYHHFSNWAAKRADERIAVLNDGTVSNEDRLGAIGDLLLAIDRYSIHEDLLVAAGDNYLRVGIDEFYAYYKKRGHKTLLLAKQVQDRDMLCRFAVAKADGDDKLLELVEKPKEPQSDLAVFALYIFPRETAQKIRAYKDEGNTMDAPGNFPQWLSERGEEMYIYRTQQDCYDIGTHESLKEVREKYGN